MGPTTNCHNNAQDLKFGECSTKKKIIEVEHNFLTQKPFEKPRVHKVKAFKSDSNLSQRFAIALSAILLSGMGALSTYSCLQSRQLFDNQTINKILPLTSDSVTTNIRNLISQTMLASRLTADNSLLVKLLLAGNQKEDAISSYLTSVQKKHWRKDGIS